LVRNGSERVVTSTREHLFDLRQLENYTFVDEFGKDQGINGMYIHICYFSEYFAALLQCPAKAAKVSVNLYL